MSSNLSAEALPIKFGAPSSAPEKSSPTVWSLRGLRVDGLFGGARFLDLTTLLLNPVRA
ncbi:hypothetical protein CCP2SC5_270039 [Azospirillaceae bacterium]